MSPQMEKMQERIARKGIQATDIKHSGLLTEKQIQFIEFDKVYMWVRTGEEYDTRVSIPIDLPDDELFVLMKLAHERDITFNQLVELALTEALEKYEAEQRSEYGVYS